MEGFLSLGFMQRALVGMIAVSLACGILSGFIVLRGLSFIGAGLAHAAFGGVALGWFFGFPPLPTAGVFCAVTALGIDVVSRRGRVTPDAAIGVLFSAAMALGLILVGLANRYTPDLLGVLFGSILTIGWTDVAAATVVLALSVLFVVVFKRELGMSTFHEELARVEGVNVAMVARVFLLLLSAVIVVAIKAVGVVLVSALLVIPGATARPWARTLGELVLLSCLISLVSAVGGLALSYLYDLPPGATIVLVAAGIFSLSHLFVRSRIATGH